MRFCSALDRWGCSCWIFIPLSLQISTASSPSSQCLSRALESVLRLSMVLGADVVDSCQRLRSSLAMRCLTSCWILYSTACVVLPRVLAMTL